MFSFFRHPLYAFFSFFLAHILSHKMSWPPPHPDWDEDYARFYVRCQRNSSRSLYEHFLQEYDTKQKIWAELSIRIPVVVVEPPPEPVVQSEVPPPAPTQQQQQQHHNVHPLTVLMLFTCMLCTGELLNGIPG